MKPDLSAEEWKEFMLQIFAATRNLPILCVLQKVITHTKVHSANQVLKGDKHFTSDIVIRPFKRLF